MKMDQLLKTIATRTQTEQFLNTVAEIYAHLNEEDKLKIVETLGGTYNIARTTNLLEELSTPEIDYTKMANVSDKLDSKLKDYFSNILPNYITETRIIDFGDSTNFGDYFVGTKSYVVEDVDLKKSEDEIVESLYSEVVKSVEFKIQEMIDNGSGISGQLKDFHRAVKIVYETAFVMREGLIYKVGYGIIPNA